MDYFLYSAFIQSALQLRPHIHPYILIYTPVVVATMQGANLHIGSNSGLSILLNDKFVLFCIVARAEWERMSSPSKDMKHCHGHCSVA